MEVKELQQKIREEKDKSRKEALMKREARFQKWVQSVTKEEGEENMMEMQADVDNIGQDSLQEKMELIETLKHSRLTAVDEVKKLHEEKEADQKPIN